MVSPLTRGALLGLAALTAACQHRPMADPTAAGPSAKLHVRLPRLGFSRHRAVDLWVARPLGTPRRPLVLHLTGDSGRHGWDLILYARLTRWGYPVAILSSPGWVNTLPHEVATPQALARDLDAAARAAAGVAGVPEEEPFILLGQSRGADLAVEAAGEPLLRQRLRGVVALGLCEDEERVTRDGAPGRPYRDKALLGELPLEVIQSTHDRFLAAAKARALFGADTDHQQFHAIEADSHTFVGAREAALEQLRLSLERVWAP